MAETSSTFDAALASHYSSERLEGMLYAWTSPQRPRPQPATAHECDNCGAPWHDEHQADSGPCFYCHARRPGELHVGDVVGGRAVVAMTRGEPTFDAIPLAFPKTLLDATSEAMMLANDRLREKQAKLMAQQAKLDSATIVGCTRSGLTAGLLRRALGRG